MQFRNAYLRSLVHSSQKLWPKPDKDKFPRVELNEGAVFEQNTFSNFGLFIKCNTKQSCIFRNSKKCFYESVQCSSYFGRETSDRIKNIEVCRPLLLRHWYEIMALYYVKSILTEISASRQDRRVLQKKLNHQNQSSEHMGHATDVWIRLEIKKSRKNDFDRNLTVYCCVLQRLVTSNEKVYKCGRECNFFCRECKFVLPQLDIMHRGMI